MVEFSNVSKIYDKLINAVDDVSFSIDDGEFIFLIGPSGSGKTTIIKMLIRDEVPTSGSILFNDTDITKVSRNKVYKLRREIGVIFQDFKLVPEKTAYENVAFAMEAAGKKNKEIKETVPYVLDIVGLSDRTNAFPRQLSGGEQQRVAIARAISNNPKILIADEPTGNLDPASSWDIVQVLTKINNWGTTVIMSTHGTDIVNSLNKRVIQMEGGKIIRDDNKGQYELAQNPDDEVVDQNVPMEKFSKSEDDEEPKKKVYQVKIKSNLESEPSDESKSEDEETSEGNKKDSNNKNPFSRIFGVFRKNKDVEVEQPEESIVTELSEGSQNEDQKETEVEEEDEKSESNSDESQELKEDEEKDDSKKPASSKMARTIEKEEKSEKNVDDKDYEEALNNAGKISIDDMKLPKSVKRDLKSSGYKTVQDIVNAGPDELSKNLVIDPEEVILVSKEIKKLLGK